jgi:hypothetical protein
MFHARETDKLSMAEMDGFRCAKETLCPVRQDRQPTLPTNVVIIIITMVTVSLQLRAHTRFFLGYIMTLHRM